MLPLVAILGTLIGSTVVGVAPIRKLIQVGEARHELRQGSPGFIRSIAGWSVIAFWLGGTWFTATILGDWAASGDLEGALDRSWVRLWILMEILETIASYDV